MKKIFNDRIDCKSRTQIVLTVKIGQKFPDFSLTFPVSQVFNDRWEPCNRLKSPTACAAMCFRVFSKLHQPSLSTLFVPNDEISRTLKGGQNTIHILVMAIGYSQNDHLKRSEKSLGRQKVDKFTTTVSTSSLLYDVIGLHLWLSIAYEEVCNTHSWPCTATVEF